MFSNKRRTIGVVLERATSEYQNNLCQGIITKAEKLGYNTAIFSAFGKYGQNERYFIGDQTIWTLPSYEDFDGMILALDTVINVKERQKIIQMVKERCHCPVVSVREIVEGTNKILVDNRTCMAGIIEHFIVDHGMKRLCFMTGPENHWDARERLEGFLDKMKEHNLPVTEHQYFWGDYWKGKGKEACDWFLGADERPEAIVCANDHMAMAVASELNGRGFRVPEDICVSGYDGLRGTASFSPSVTTVEVPFFDMGMKAVELIDQKQECPQDIETIYFDTILKKRESCGCMSIGGKETMDLRQYMFEQENKDENREMQFHFMSMHLSECHSVDEISERLAYYAYNLDGFRDYCLCLCDGIMENGGSDTYTDRMNVQIAILDRQEKRDIRVAFDKRELLPAEITGEEPQIWYFAPVHFHEKCFGYEALRFYDAKTTGKLYLYWNTIMGNQIQNIITYQKMKSLMKQLENMYDRDALTGIYNRRGFENYANPMFTDAKQKGESVFLAVIDLDGMKQINDNYGHIEGDFALCKVAGAISQALPDGAIMARTGGDEFEVIAVNLEENEGLVCMGNIEKYLDKFNAANEKEYDIHASFGTVKHVPGEKDTLETFIKESDEVMYMNKIANKTRRGEPLR